ncbi:MAG: hypothetical protein KKG59_06480 [Nanoarchaeota archaeon]|nr:hypothetical protein [Nanoarchaeota archaeon]
MRVGFFYDFDLTLSEEYQQFPLFRHFTESLKEKYPWFEKPEDYWRLCQHCDLGVGYMEQMVTHVKNGVFSGLTNEQMESEFGPQIELSSGLPGWFPRMGDFCDSNYLDPEHHVISVGIDPLIRGTSIAPHLTSVTSGKFRGNSKGITKISNIVDPFQKVEVIKTICKGDLYTDLALKDYHINYRHALVFGDGFTDRDMFRYIRQRGGIAICVFEPGNRPAYENAVHNLGGDGTLNSSVTILAPRDYRAGSVLEEVTQEMLHNMVEREKHCDMDYLLVHSMLRGQLEHPQINEIVSGHYQDCKWCQKLTSPQLIFS